MFRKIVNTSPTSKTQGKSDASSSAPETASTQKIIAPRRILSKENLSVKRKFQPILMQSTPVDEDSLDSFGEESYVSEDIDVLHMTEDIKYFNRVTIGSLTRIGPRRPLWNNKFGSYFVIFTFLLNYDSLIMFANNLDKYGLKFVFTYATTAFSIGFPIMYMEFALGQYTSSNAVAVFDRIMPAFVGVGIASILLHLISMLSDQIIMAQFILISSYTINMFVNEMPWHNCVTSENNPKCVAAAWCTSQAHTLAGTATRGRVKYTVLGQSCIRSETALYTGVEHKYGVSNKLAEHPVLQFLLGETDLKEMGFPDWPSFTMVFTVSLCWMLISISAKLDRSKIVLLSKTAVYLLGTVIVSMIVVFIFVSPPAFPFINAVQGEFPDISHSEIFYAAVAMTFRTLRLGQAKFIFVGSQCIFHNNILTDCFIIFLVVSSVPLFYSLIHLLARDSFILEMARGNMNIYYQSAEAFSKTYASQVHIQSIEMPFFVSSLEVFHSSEPVILFIFSIMGALISLAGKVVEMEILLTTVLENLSILSNHKDRKIIMQGIIITTSILFMFFFGSQGYEILIGVENVTKPVTSYVIVLFELIVVAYFYGSRRMIANITAMSTVNHGDGNIDWKRKSFNLIMMFVWCLLCPAVILYALYCFMADTERATKDVVLPSVLAIAVLAIIPGALIYRVVLRLRRKLTIVRLFEPDQDFWGPRSRHDRERAEKIERQIRNIA